MVSSAWDSNAGSSGVVLRLNMLRTTGMSTLVTAAAIIIAVAGHIIHCTTYLKCECACENSAALPHDCVRKAMVASRPAPSSESRPSMRSSSASKCTGTNGGPSRVSTT